jgi:hypothetical protein
MYCSTNSKAVRHLRFTRGSLKFGLYVIINSHFFYLARHIAVFCIYVIDKKSIILYYTAMDNDEDDNSPDIGFKDYRAWLSFTDAGDDRRHQLAREYPMYAQWQRNNIFNSIKALKKKAQGFSPGLRVYDNDFKEYERQ